MTLVELQRTIENRRLREGLVSALCCYRFGDLYARNTRNLVMTGKKVNS